MTSLTLRPITADEHLGFIDSHGAVSFLQTPAWGRVKSGWDAESIGWFAGDDLVGAGLVLYRRLPKVRRSLAYLPEGPAIDWASASADLGPWLDPLVAHVKRRGSFAVRMGPPVLTRRWTAQQVKDGIADPAQHRLGDVPPSERSPIGAGVVSQLLARGWIHQGSEEGFAAGQPQYNFHLPLLDRTEADVLAGMNQLWRRNIRKAERSGVEVTENSSDAALGAFHDLYVHTAERDHFTPRPLAYFLTMRDALQAEEPSRFTLWNAHHEGDLVASTIAIRVGPHAWYSYGASSTAKRDVRGSNAVQWAMIRDALRAGCAVYDLRGITDALDPADPHTGLIQFKVGTGGEAVEYAGEWDLPINRLLYKAFDYYLSRR